MDVKVWPSPIKVPDASSNSWEFSVTVSSDDGVKETGPYVVGDVDLREVFFEATGRHLNALSGVNGDKEELDKNWNIVEPKLRDRITRNIKSRAA